MIDSHSEFIYLAKLLKSPYIKKTRIWLGGSTKPETAYLKDIKIFLGFTKNATHLDIYFNTWKKEGILVEVERTVSNKDSKRVNSKYILNADRIIDKIKDFEIYAIVTEANSYKLQRKFVKGE